MNTRLSHLQKHIADPNTPGYAPNKASDLIAHMNNKVSLPRIQSSRSNQLSYATPSLVSRQQSRAKMLEIQNKAIGMVKDQDFSSRAADYKKDLINASNAGR